MNTGLINLVFSDNISESVKLELITRVLEKTPQEAVVNSLFFNASESEDYLYILENLPKVGVFKDIKRQFWKKLGTLNEGLVCEVSNEYIRRASLRVLHNKGLTDEIPEGLLSSDGDAPIGLTGLRKEWGEDKKPGVKKKLTLSQKIAKAERRQKREEAKADAKAKTLEPVGLSSIRDTYSKADAARAKVAKLKKKQATADDINKSIKNIKSVVGKKSEEGKDNKVADVTASMRETARAIKNGEKLQVPAEIKKGEVSKVDLSTKLPAKAEIKKGETVKADTGFKAPAVVDTNKKVPATTKSSDSNVVKPTTKVWVEDIPSKEDATGGAAASVNKFMGNKILGKKSEKELPRTEYKLGAKQEPEKEQEQKPEVAKDETVNTESSKKVNRIKALKQKVQEKKNAGKKSGETTKPEQSELKKDEPIKSEPSVASAQDEPKKRGRKKKTDLVKNIVDTAADINKDLAKPAKKVKQPKAVKPKKSQQEEFKQEVPAAKVETKEAEKKQEPLKAPELKKDSNVATAEPKKQGKKNAASAKKSKQPELKKDDSKKFERTGIPVQDDKKMYSDAIAKEVDSLKFKRSKPGYSEKDFKQHIDKINGLVKKGGKLPEGAEELLKEKPEQEPKNLTEAPKGMEDSYKKYNDMNKSEFARLLTNLQNRHRSLLNNEEPDEREIELSRNNLKSAIDFYKHKYGDVNK